MQQQLKLTTGVSSQPIKVEEPTTAEAVTTDAAIETGQTTPAATAAASTTATTAAITPARIDKAISWYRANKPQLEQALPIKLPGATYKPGWIHSLERQIEQWESSSNRGASLTIATAYIHSPLTKIRNKLNS